jgi:hypothetical protein
MVGVLPQIVVESFLLKGILIFLILKKRPKKLFLKFRKINYFDKNLQRKAGIGA